MADSESQSARAVAKAIVLLVALAVVGGILAAASFAKHRSMTGLRRGMICGGDGSAGNPGSSG